MRKEQLAIYLVTDRELSLGRSLEEIVTQAVKGGVTMVQLREKDASTKDFLDLAIRLKAVLGPLQVPLIINDRLDIALASDADGVHIGQSDMPYETARKLLGPEKIIGLSVETFEEIEEANKLDVDYIGVSPVFATPTKTDTFKPFGIEGLRKAVQMSVHPAVAIGGINLSTADEVSSTGAAGLAVVSAICSAPSPEKAARDLGKVFYKYNWTAQAWNASAKIFHDITTHPFITELSDGSLSEEKFARYIAQDEIYIGNYGKEMFDLAAMLPEGGMRDMFTEFAKSGIEMEAAMHQLLIERFGIDCKVNASSVTRAYNAHTAECIASGNLHLAMASMLPCTWIYNEVGLYIYKLAKKEGNPYREWIEAYSSEEFTAAVEDIVKMCDTLAAEASDELRESMTRAYLKSAQFEWDFWDYGYNGIER